MPRPTPNLTGQRFGRLTVIERAENKGKKAAWRAVCDCGKGVAVRGEVLTRGDTRSCGCLRREASRARRPPLNERHGHSPKYGPHSREYNSWHSAKQRCGNEHNKRWKHYGGRGITMCERWRESFENFLADMGPRPAGKTLDRVNNNGNYEPGNCRWATTKEQRANQRKRKLTCP